MRASWTCVAVLASSAEAQIALRPAAYTATRGSETPIRCLDIQGERAIEAEWPADVEWFFVRLAGTQENRGTDDAPKSDAARAVRVELRVAGAAKVGVDLKARLEDWPQGALTEFAAQSGDDAVCPQGTSRVRCLLSAATLVRVNEADGSAAADPTAVGKSGQAVEIRPLMDPTVMPAGGVLPVRVYVLGDSAKGGMVTATHVASRTRQRVQADAKGIADIQIDKAGEWRVEFHALRALKEEEAAWLAAVATLTFEAPEAPAPKEEAP